MLVVRGCGCDWFGAYSVSSFCHVPDDYVRRELS